MKCNFLLVEDTGADLSIGAIYTKDMVECLTDDMYWAEVGDYGVDVSWYPEHDLSGCYHITLIKDDWNNQLYTRQLDDPKRVVKLVQGLIKECIEMRDRDEQNDISGRYQATNCICNQREAEC